MVMPYYKIMKFLKTIFILPIVIFILNCSDSEATQDTKELKIIKPIEAKD